MVDIKLIREQPERVRESCRKRGVDVDIDLLLDLDKKRRELLVAMEDMAAQKNRANEEIKRAKDARERDAIILKMRELDGSADRVSKEFREVDEAFRTLMLQVPNLVQDDVPEGTDERGNLVLREEGKKPAFHFAPKEYLELAENLDIIDVKRAAKVSGSRFGYLKGGAVRLEFALVNFAFDELQRHGFVPLVPPVLIKEDAMRGMGYIDTEADRAERYFLEKDKLFLVGTSEQSVGPMHADEVFEEKDLPRRYVAFSTCFREEAGSYGKDTKGILRVHQFDKVEMFSFCHPATSRHEHQFLLNTAESLLQKLEIPYRVVQLCAGDLARPSAATYDIESWMPGQSTYRETNSISNCTDFQARRLNIRYRARDGKLHFVHTLNGTAFAIGRTLIAIIENYQQHDGSVAVPRVLQKYVDFKSIHPSKQ